jgi:hypothetical protein
VPPAAPFPPPPALPAVPPLRLPAEPPFPPDPLVFESPLQPDVAIEAAVAISTIPNRASKRFMRHQFLRVEA